MDDRLQIASRHRRILEALLREHLPGVEVWAYGSRVNGRGHSGSDLDLALRAPNLEKLPAGQLSDFEDAVRESSIPFLVEVHDWARLPERFHEAIERDYMVLHGEAVDVDSSTTAPLTARVGATEGGGRDGWRETTLGEVVTLKRGYDLPQSQRLDGPVPVVSSSGITDHHRESKVCGPGVVTGRYGTLGQVFFIRDDFWPLNTALYVRDFKGNDPRFISYFLMSLDFSAFSDKAAVPGLNRNHLHEEPVQIPATLDDQRAIAHILGTLDDKIELNRRMNATLESMARALFRSWFVDFDPVRAKMEGRDPGLPKEIADLFPDQLADSDLGDIPDGWDVSEIGAEVDAVGGGTPSTKEPAYWNGGGHCWATPKDLSKQSSPALLGTDRKITDAGVRKISSGLLPRGTVLLSSRAPIGYLAITEVPTAINQGFIAMVCRKRLPALYVLSWCHDNLDHIKNISGGSTFAEISKKTFRPLPVVVPPKPVLWVYDEASRSLHDRVVSNTRESALLASLRDALLPRLVSGEGRVNDWNR